LYKYFHERGIELSTRSLAEYLQGPMLIRRCAISSRCGNRVEAIGNSDETSQERNSLAPQAVGIAVAVDPFVMPANGHQDFSITNNRGQDAFSGGGVQADEG
jgi:hypothetical protein